MKKILLLLIVTFGAVIYVLNDSTAILKGETLTPTFESIQTQLAMTETLLNKGRFLQRANSPEGLAPEEVAAFQDLILTRRTLQKYYKNTLSNQEGSVMSFILRTSSSEAP